MADTVTVRIDGLRELERTLETLPPQIARRILRRALRLGARVFLAEMQNRVARRTGFLAQHLALRLHMDRNELAGSARVGPLTTNYPRDNAARLGVRLRARSTITAATVARFLEFGTRKMRAFPFMRQAFESQKAAALAVFTAAARDAFDEASRAR